MNFPLALPDYNAQGHYGEDNRADQWIGNTSFVFQHDAHAHRSVPERPPGESCQAVLCLSRVIKNCCFFLMNGKSLNLYTVLISQNKIQIFWPHQETRAQDHTGVVVGEPGFVFVEVSVRHVEHAEAEDNYDPPDKRGFHYVTAESNNTFKLQQPL